MRHRIFPSLLSLSLALGLCVLPAAALETDDLKTLLQTFYVDQVPENVLDQDTVQAVLDALNDPYTTYMTAEEYQSFLNQVDGETVVGIGVSIQTTVNDGVQILSVLEGSPAQEAGLSAGDRILSVDGVTLERRAVVIPIVTYELKDGDVGYIKCDSFGASTAATVQEALEELEGQADIWIMDLRSNPGGTDAAVNLTAGKFTNGIMVYMLSADGLAYYRGIRPDAPDYTDGPVVVLTSPWSASGAEMFAAAARDHSFGFSVGQRTYGKGVAQLVLDEKNAPALFDGDCLKVTAYRFYSPNGVTNDTMGVLPTLLISQENTEAAARLLRADVPGIADGSLKLELAGHTFYLDDRQARHVDNRAAFTELLEALPPSARLSVGYSGSTWTEVAPEELAQQWGLEFHSRTFSDTASSPFAQAIDTLAVYGLLSGYEDGTFHPGETITRAEFSAMVASALNLRRSDSAPFSDVDPSAWYAGAVNAMAAKGFLSGDGDGRFRPEDTISYEEMVTVLSSVAAWATMEGRELAEESLSAGDWGVYHDFSEWAQIPARNLDRLGALAGSQQPREPGTRETAAGLLHALLESAGLLWD